MNDPSNKLGVERIRHAVPERDPLKAIEQKRKLSKLRYEFLVRKGRAMMAGFKDERESRVDIK